MTPQQQHEIGTAVLKARAGRAPAPWKLLERTYNRSRAQLWRYAKTVREGVAFGQMQHRPRCDADRLAA